MSTPNIRQNLPVLRLGLALALGLALLLGLLLAMGAIRPVDVALAQGPTTRYVAPPPSGDDSSNDCTTSSAPCATVQHAVDVADPGDEIRVASGTYTDTHVRPRNDITTTGVVTQVAYISKSVTIRGGYTSPFTDLPDPDANPTTLDAGGQGRVLYITGNISPTIEGLRITNGKAAGLGGSPSGDSGGGVLVISATVTLRNSQMFSNIAAFGGGLYFYTSPNVMLIGNIIDNNTGETHAGGFYFRDSPGATLINNTISDNIANHLGGGMKHYGGILFANSDDATLTDNTISGNGAANHCGGVCFSNSDNAMLVGNAVISNSAGSPGFVEAEGGGLRFISSANVSLINNVITDNSAITFGGGVYLERSDATLINIVVADNQLLSTDLFTGSGSGLYIAGSSPQLLHSTIARNSGDDGSGVYVTDIFGSLSTVTMTNTILVSHTVGVTATAGNTATLNGVLWDSNTANTGGLGAITVTNAYTGDPAFAEDGYHLTVGSAAIDRGVDAEVTTDIDGDPRPADGDLDGMAIADLGADEYLLKTYLPLIVKNSGL